MHLLFPTKFITRSLAETGTSPNYDAWTPVVGRRIRNLQLCIGGLDVALLPEVVLGPEGNVC